MTKAQMFEMDTDGFPALAAIILAEREISSAREWVEEGGLSQDEFDLKRAVELAKEATMSKEDSDESPLHRYVWDDGSSVVLVWGTDQDPDEMRGE